MTAPAWLSAVIGEFGRAAGLGGFALNNSGAAALKFETGASLRLEYTGAELVVAMSVSMTATLVALQRLLALSHPRARHGGFRIRAGVLMKSGEAIIAIRLAERDVTLVQLNAAFSALWRLAEEIGDGSWA